MWWRVTWFKDGMPHTKKSPYQMCKENKLGEFHIFFSHFALNSVLFQVHGNLADTMSHEVSFQEFHSNVHLQVVICYWLVVFHANHTRVSTDKGERKNEARMRYRYEAKWKRNAGKWKYKGSRWLDRSRILAARDSYKNLKYSMNFTPRPKVEYTERFIAFTKESPIRRFLGFR